MSALADGDRPYVLRELVRYQDHAIVSQTLVKAKAGTVTVFAFDAGEGLSEHTAPFDALIYALEGDATITIGSSAHTLASGQIIRLPANVPHSVHALTRCKLLLIMIRESAGAPDVPAPSSTMSD